MKPFNRILSAGVCPALVFALFFSACSDELRETTPTRLDLPSTPYAYSLGENDHVPTLGRVLFYDVNVSINNSIACASCHKQVLGFSDNVQFSKGFENTLTTRNSMPIQNLAGVFGSQNLFWDGRETNLSQMVLKPIVNHVEMGIYDMDELARKLAAIPYYRDLFVNAYGSTEIKSWMLSDALSTFLLSIRSTNTKFDRVNNGVEKLSALEEKGKELFFHVYDCNSCHQVQNPSGYIEAGTFANVGLDDVYSDSGLESVTKARSDAGKFKIPSLRNVALTGPYMHDGRFQTLEEVLSFYSDDISNNENLDFRLRDEHGNPKRFEISPSDQTAIIAFLNTLTDLSMISDPKLSNPFKPQ